MSVASGPAWVQAPVIQTEGTWRSPGYRSARLRARAAYIAFGLLLLTVLVLAGLHATQAGLIEQIIRGDFPSERDLIASDDSVRVASSWYLIFWVASAIAFFCWLSRSVENAPPLGAGTPVRSPRESIGWWFVPIASFLIPYQIVRNLYERLSTPQRNGKGGLVPAWWILFFVGGAFGLAASRAANGTDPTAQQLLTASQMMTLSDIVDAIGIGFALWLIHEVQARADLRATALGLGAAGAAVWPAGAPTPQGPSAPPAPVAAAAAGGGMATIILFCPGCGQPRLPDARFCAGCGRDLAALGTVGGSGA